MIQQKENQAVFFIRESYLIIKITDESTVKDFFANLNNNKNHTECAILVQSIQSRNILVKNECRAFTVVVVCFYR